MKNYRKHLVRSQSTIKEALIRLDELSTDAILFVVDNEDRLLGALTDGDVRRGLIKEVSVDEYVDVIIQSNPKYIRKSDFDIHKTIELREGLLKVIPVLNERDQVIDIINFRKTRSYLPIDVVVMAGGRGERLMPLTKTVPKPLLPVGTKAIIEHNIDRIASFGASSFWISINYLGDLISDYFNDGNDKDIKIKYIKEDMPLGTIGSVTLIDDFEHQYILLTNSDILTNLDYESFFLDFLNSNSDLSVVSVPYNINIPYAVLELESDQVKSFKEKPTYTFYSNGGIYLMKKSVLDYVPRNTFFNTTDLMEILIEKNHKVTSYPLMEYWIDIGTPEDYAKAQHDVNKIKF